MKRKLLVLGVSLLFITIQAHSQINGALAILTFAGKEASEPNRLLEKYTQKSLLFIEEKPTVYIAVTDSLPPLNTLVRTHVNIDGNIGYEQKAILKEDGWYWPSGLTKLSWVPTHWESI